MSNIIDKIWESHIVKHKEGFPNILAIDLHLMHEVTSPQAFDELRRRKLKVHAPERCVATVDHNISTATDRITNVTELSRHQTDTLRDNCKEFGIKLMDMNSGKQGIIHVIGPELGLVQPGMTIICGDSHTATHGAFGALAFGVGSTEVGHVFATGSMLQHKPKTMKVHFKGEVGNSIAAKDLILKLIQSIGIGGATGHIIEYTGDVIKKMNMEERMTICNMSIECGARSGLVSPDEVTFDYLRNRLAVHMSHFDEAITYWSSFTSDDDSNYDNEIEIDISNMAPMVTWGTNPGQGMEVDQIIPNVSSDLDCSALEYTKLSSGKPISGTLIDYVFIGSCTNGRISDLRAAAEIFKGNHITDGVIAYIVPGSEAVHKQAIFEGLDKIFIEAGCDFRMPGCSMCLAMNQDVVPPGKRCASTSNRNFVGRQGPNSITHLMSPVMAATAAILGKITNCQLPISK